MRKIRKLDVKEIKNAFANFDDIYKDDGEGVKFVKELLMHLGYDANVKIKRQGVCIDGFPEIINGKMTDRNSGNFGWWEIDSGKVIIVTKADMPVSNLLRFLSDEIKPEVVWKMQVSNTN